MPKHVEERVVRIRTDWLVRLELLLPYLSIELTLGGPIVPGQPITFSWISTPFGLADRLDLGNVTATLYPVDDLGDANQTFPLHQVTVSAATLVSGVYQAPTRSVTPLGPIAPPLYKIGGGQRVVMVLAGTGKTAGPFVSDAQLLHVVEEPGVRSWFELKVPPTAEWKAAYQITASFRNKSQFSSFAVAALLRESDNQGNPPINIPADAAQYPVPKGSTQLMTFDGHNFSKQWEWFVPGLWLQHPPYEVTYFCLLNGGLFDAFENKYEFFGPSASMLVSVSTEKRALCGLAYSLNIVSIALFAAAMATACLPVAGAILFSSSGTAAAAAAAFGAGAADPPAPDPLYKQQVMVPEFTLPPEFRAHKLMRPVFDAMELVWHIGALCCALPLIESKILGAEVARDRRGQTAQRKALAEARKGIAVSARKLEKIAAAAIEGVKKHPVMARGNIAQEIQRLASSEVTRKAYAEHWVAAGGAPETFELLIRTLASPTAAKLASGVPLAVAMQYALTAALAVRRGPRRARAAK